MIHPDVESALEAICGGAVPADLESSVLDFKTVGRSVGDTLKDLAEAATCFANAHGGTVLVGVRDKTPGVGALEGSTLDADSVVMRIYELTDPSLIVMAATYMFRDVPLTAITVPRSPDVHQVGGKATERVGTSCRPMSTSRIASVLEFRRGDDWSAKLSGIDADEISATAVESARDLLSQAPSDERRSWANLPWPDLSRRLGVVQEGKLTNAGALLFGNDNQLAGRYIRKASNAGLISSNDELTGPLVLVIRRVLELIESRAERTAMITSGGEQLLISELPTTAVREAVVNAFIHRDYRLSGEVIVEHAASRLRVTSPGPLVPGVTPENILTVSSRCRNLSLAQAVRALNLAESAGVGVDRMYASMAAIGHQPPTFDADDVTVSTSLAGGPPNEPVTRFVAGLPEDRRGDPDTLLVLLHLLRHRTVTAKRICRSLQKSEAEAEAVLLRLSSPGAALIERTADTSRSRSGEYRLVGTALASLGTAVSYRARSGDDTDRKIVSIVKESGSINGKMVQTIFDITPPTASRILSDLVDRGILIKTSSATRGPSVKYGPGPNFPKARKVPS